MKRLRKIIEMFDQTVSPQTTLGGSNAHWHSQIQMLCERLKEAQASNDKYVLGCSVVIVAIVVLEVATVWVMRHDLRLMSAATGVFGASVAWLIRKLLAVVRESQLLRILIAGSVLDQQSFRKLMDLVRNQMPKQF